ncbi:hypothetical protein WN72_04595 [Bradyrhizobium arachidis]|uniref:Uncharacterized protein n=1 Tax=Bradyrhizobium arachidis TaxID=858423 RepID=A0AAE7TF32_9BRAD|nr:hypothetical protein WN72_04595 [Bradyrhizobium arachidis]
MRGTLRESNCHLAWGESPSPPPSPRKRGEGAMRRCIPNRSRLNPFFSRRDNGENLMSRSLPDVRHAFFRANVPVCQDLAA